MESQGRNSDCLHVEGHMAQINTVYDSLWVLDRLKQSWVWCVCMEWYNYVCVLVYACECICGFVCVHKELVVCMHMGVVCVHKEWCVCIIWSEASRCCCGLVISFIHV